MSTARFITLRRKATLAHLAHPCIEGQSFQWHVILEANVGEMYRQMWLPPLITADRQGLGKVDRGNQLITAQDCT